MFRNLSVSVHISVVAQEIEKYDRTLELLNQFLNGNTKYSFNFLKTDNTKTKYSVTGKERTGIGKVEDNFPTNQAENILLEFHICSLGLLSFWGTFFKACFQIFCENFIRSLKQVHIQV